MKYLRNLLNSKMVLFATLFFLVTIIGIPIQQGLCLETLDDVFIHPSGVKITYNSKWVLNKSEDGFIIVTGNEDKKMMASIAVNIITNYDSKFKKTKDLDKRLDGGINEYIETNFNYRVGSKKMFSNYKITNKSDVVWMENRCVYVECIFTSSNDDMYPGLMKLTRLYVTFKDNKVISALLESTKPIKSDDIYINEFERSRKSITVL